MHEHIVAAFVALDEAEALGCVEELYDALALADDLCRHAATAAAATAAEAAATTAAEAAATVATAEAATAAAEAAAITAAEAISATSVERIELVFSAPLIVASPSATTSIKTHVY
ncbi:hypothetical protein GCM10017612_00660 [Novosphingobium resinovorum]|nr:hypothetical protein GCM10017612_00660 [Novosphingobium resinovorum]